jgi:hypothetical protein
VDLLAVRKNHKKPIAGTKRGDTFQMILIQIKGGGAANPTLEDGKRLRAVARWHCASKVLLATCKRGKRIQFFSLHPKRLGAADWDEVSDAGTIFC